MAMRGKEGPCGRGGVPSRRTFWARAATDWGSDLSLSEAVFVGPGRPLAWRREDLDFDEACVRFEQDTERQILGDVRRRALGGDSRAQNLCFRATRGFARAVNLAPPPRELDVLPPEVAGAMIEAGLAAMGLPPEDIPDPVWK